MLKGCNHQFVPTPPRDSLHCKFCNIAAPAINNPYILIPPGGPNGPFWGVMRQSGLIIATQMQERDTAESLIAVLNIIDGDFDFDTVESAVREYEKIWESDPDPGAEDYLIKQLGRALGGAAKELTGNGG